MYHSMVIFNTEIQRHRVFSVSLNNLIILSLYLRVSVFK